MTFLITGAGRSGTKYIARVLRQAGLRVGHERSGADGTVSSIWLVSDSVYPSYHDQERPEKFDPILLQTREPLATISSLTTGLRGSWQWNARHIPIEVPNSDEEKLRTAALYWLYWNNKALQVCDYHYQIEDLEYAWETICGYLNIDSSYADATSGIPRNVNARRHPRYEWSDIYKVLTVVEYDELRTTARVLRYL